MSKNFIANSLRQFVFVAACLAVFAGQAFAQSTVTGGIRGSVTDPQEAVIPNVAVTVTNLGTNTTQTATTDDNGNFVVNNLQPGTYKVNVTQTGFAAFNAERVVVEVGQVTTINANLSVNEVTGNTVEVTADAPVINTNSQDFSTNINQISINELPINGRRASNFVLLTPATVPDGTFGLISFRGISGLLNNSTVDGGDNNQAFQSEERGRTRIGYVVSQSAIREFQVNTSNYSSEYGRSAGGVINTVTKSGTNEFHGDLFEYYRNNRFGARNPLAFRTLLDNGVQTVVGIKPTDIRHQFGGTIGGPIVKDKLFFFFSYDQQKRNFPGLAIFSNLNYLNTVDRVLLTTPLGQQVPGRPNGVLGKGLTTTQVDESLGFINSLTGETPRRQDQTLILPKIDWQINGSNLFSASYNRLRAESPAGLQTQATNTIARRSFGDDFVNVDSLNMRLQSNISPTVLNEARFQYSRDNEFAFSQEPLPGEPTTATTVAGARSPSVNLTGGLTFGTTANFERVKFPDEKRFQFADSVTYIRGRHSFKFGGDFNNVTDDIENLRSQTGSYIYSTINDFIIDYTNSRTPLAATTACATGTNRVGRCYNGTYLQGIGIPGLKFTTREYNLFFQDDFRISQRLTINAGLRYEYQQTPDTVLPNASTAIIPNDGRTLNEATSTLPSDKNNFGPRIGLAYDLTGDGKTSLRAGYGIYYGRIINAQIYNALLNTGNPGGQGQFTVNANVTTNCFPLVPTATQACAPIFPNILPSSLPLNQSAIQFFQKDFQAPMIHQYDFIVERQIAKNTVVSVSYIGSTGRSLPTFVDQNLRSCQGVVSTPQVCPFGATATFTVNGGPNAGQTFSLPQFTRTNTAFAQLTQIGSSVRSNYNALVLQFNRRFTDGLQIQSSYTLAKSRDSGQNSSVFPVNNSPLDFTDKSFDSGPSNNDVRHKFVVSGVYAPNFYKGSDNSFYNYLLNGYSIAPIYTFYSGRPFDGTVSGLTLNGTSGDTRFPLNGRNAFRLPSISNLDLRLSKRFRFTERYNLELLAEGFNVFNRTQVFIQQGQLYTRLSNTSTVLNYNPAFGSTTETSSSNYRERQIQFAARFQF